MAGNSVGDEGKTVAGTAEILAFYTSVMRGEEEDASFANRISAADKLLSRHDGDDPATHALAHLDLLLGELRRALADGTFVVSHRARDDCVAEDAGSDAGEDGQDDGEEDDDEDDEDQ